METQIFTVENEGNIREIHMAAEIIRRGGLVALPTETVYGLGADGLNPCAIRKIYEVKGRPTDKPISLLVSGIEAIERLAVSPPECAIRLAEHFWPGPLTIVLERSRMVPDIVAAGGGTVGLRCPMHPVTLAIIRNAGVPVAAPSANISGGISPKNAQDVIKTFFGKIDGIVDGGTALLGTESTIIDCTSQPPKILRHGGLCSREIEAVIGEVVL